MDSEPTISAAAGQGTRRSTEMLTFDPDAMVVAVQDGVLEHVQLEAGVFSGRIAHTTGTDSRVDWGSYTLSVLARGDFSRDMITLILPVTGHGDWRLHGRLVAAGELLVFPENGELLATLPRRAQWLSLQFPRSRLEASDLALTRLLAGGIQRFAAGRAGGWLQTLNDLAPAIGPGAAGATFGAAEVRQAHEELLSALLSELLRRGGADDTTTRLSPGERQRVVRRAEEFLACQGDPSVRIDDLCVAASTSLSRLERAFREAFGVGPRRYLTLRRLAAARAALLRGDPNTSVTEIATHWGFFHLGRFSQEYRQLYAEQPSETLRARRRIA
jgi:AraC family transcriptional regulator, ethanolamine operon transcriptional activator